jgi:hypothetical protein
LRHLPAKRPVIAGFNETIGCVADWHHLGYIRPMIHKLILLSCGISGIVLTMPLVRADQVEMLNGDRLSGKVLFVTAEIPDAN